MTTLEEMIRKRAHELWEKSGMPQGRSDKFWFAARAEFESVALPAEKREADAPVRPPKASPAPAAAKGSAAARPGVKPKTKRT
jgi:hypothetical protein